MATVAPFTAFLIESFDWRWALLILGGITWLVMLPIAQLFKKDPQEIGALPDGDSIAAKNTAVDERIIQPIEMTLLQAFRTRNFWSFLLIWVLLAFSSFFVLTHIVPHATDMGFSAIESATIISMTGLAMTGGRLITGLIIDKISAKGTAIFCSLLQVGALLWLVWAQELWMLYLFGFLHGFTQGGFSTATTVLIGEAFGLTDIGKIFGLLEVGIFIGGAVGPFLGGLIFDVTGNYTGAFLIMASTVLVRVLPVVLINVEARKVTYN